MGKKSLLGLQPLHNLPVMLNSCICAELRGGMRCCAQDANKLMPNTVDTLCLAAKAWSDACYLDEIHRERLSVQDKLDVNLKAMEYAKQVCRRTPAQCCVFFL